MLFRASAPGSLMLLGEYAVLHGKHALVCAVNKRMTVTLTPRNDQVITIDSALGRVETVVSKIKITPPFKFVFAALKYFHKQLKFGCDIRIESEFSDQVGFASSAAVTVATLSALSAWLNVTMSSVELAQTARAIVRKVQGLGSGADVAACVFGGVVTYRARPFTIQKEVSSFPITVMYSGSKTPTVEAVTRVQNYFCSRPKLFKQICQGIDECAIEGARAMQQKNVSTLAEIMNIQQGLMSALGVSTPLLNNMIDELREQPAILGAKISGSGLGDCVVALGSLDLAFVSQYAAQGVNLIAAEITNQGVLCEKI